MFLYMKLVSNALKLMFIPFFPEPLGTAGPKKEIFVFCSFNHD